MHTLAVVAMILDAALVLALLCYARFWLHTSDADLARKEENLRRELERLARLNREVERQSAALEEFAKSILARMRAWDAAREGSGPHPFGGQEGRGLTAD